ncbi:MAG: hypothetical protein R3223_10225 [Longimicrobiales bacterium]|nr:hypothetical protein [Longimicrobiales bacterium]
MKDRASTLIEGRKERLERILERELSPPPGADSHPLTDEKREYLLGEAEDLYWNELEWENITEEERLDEGALTELAFPGLLAFVRGLLLQETMPDALAPARPRPEVVEDILRFLAARVVELRDEAPEEPGGEEESRIETELAMTNRLIDLITYELYGLDEEEVERIESAVEVR